MGERIKHILVKGGTQDRGDGWPKVLQRPLSFDWSHDYPDEDLKKDVTTVAVGKKNGQSGKASKDKGLCGPALKVRFRKDKREGVTVARIAGPTAAGTITKKEG